SSFIQNSRPRLVRRRYQAAAALRARLQLLRITGAATWTDHPGLAQVVLSGTICLCANSHLSREANAARQACRIRAAPGVSPWTQIVPTAPAVASRTACSAAAAGSVIRASGNFRL